MKNSRIDYTAVGAIFSLTLFISMTVFFGGIITERINGSAIDRGKGSYTADDNNSSAYEQDGQSKTDLNRRPDLWEELLRYTFDPEAGAMFETEPESEEQTEDTSHEEGDGKIVRKTYVYSQSSSCVKLALGGFMRNDTHEDMDYLIEQSNREPELEPVGYMEPLVLIMHTHTTECYTDGERDTYLASDPERSLELSETVVEVGRAITKKLAECKIGVIHDETVHDYPNYNGAYDRSGDTVAEYLEKYPSIQIVIDVHRDAIEADNIRYAPVAQIDGKQAAQVMIIVGSTNVPGFRYNLRFASRLQSKMESLYPGLTRPLLIAERNYNQHLTKGSILLEMGSSANSLEEAVYAGELVGVSLAQLIEELL